MNQENFNDHIKELEMDIHSKYKDLSHNKNEMTTANRLFLQDFKKEEEKRQDINGPKDMNSENFKELVIKIVSYL